MNMAHAYGSPMLRAAPLQASVSKIPHKNAFAPRWGIIRKNRVLATHPSKLIMLAAAGGDGSDKAAPSSAASEAVGTLRRACDTLSVPVGDVQAALSVLERAHKENSQVQGAPGGHSATDQALWSER